MSFEELKRRLEQKKIESAKAEVRLQQIKDTWMRDFGTDDVSKVEDEFKTLTQELAKAREDYNNALEAAENELLKLEA